MAKQKRKCKDCAVCEQTENLALCHFGGGEASVVFPENTACKMCVGTNKKPSKQAPAVLEAGSAPFCGDYAKCNNAEGCDSCREFEIWLQDREGK